MTQDAIQFATEQLERAVQVCDEVLSQERQKANAISISYRRERAQHYQDVVSPVYSLIKHAIHTLIFTLPAAWEQRKAAATQTEHRQSEGPQGDTVANSVPAAAPIQETQSISTEEARLGIDNQGNHRYIQTAAAPDWIALFADEVARARRKFPLWQEGAVVPAAVVCEEAGELIRAALQCEYEGGSMEACDKEAIQTAAMCIRFLERK